MVVVFTRPYHDHWRPRPLMTTRGIYMTASRPLLTTYLIVCRNRSFSHSGMNSPERDGLFSCIIFAQPQTAVI